MSETNTIIVAPAAVAAAYEGQDFGGFNVGKVTFEPEGVPGRRGLISHRWDAEGLEGVKDVLRQAGHLDRVEFVAHVPRDWRWEEDIPRPRDREAAS